MSEGYRLVCETCRRQLVVPWHVFDGMRGWEIEAEMGHIARFEGWKPYPHARCPAHATAPEAQAPDAGRAAHPCATPIRSIA